MPSREMLHPASEQKRASAWLGERIALVQQCEDSFRFADVHACGHLVYRLAESIGEPPDVATDRLLAGILLDTAAHLSDTLHCRRSYRRCECAALLADSIHEFLGPRRLSAPAVLRVWIREFVRVHTQAHPLSIADDAAILIRADPSRKWQPTEIATTLHAPTRRLQAAFQRRFSVTLSQFVHLARVTAALERLRAGSVKVEVLATDLGYRSKKDFYRAFRTWSGTTPRQMRLLSPIGFEQLDARLRLQCVGGAQLVAQ